MLFGIVLLNFYFCSDGVYVLIVGNVDSLYWWFMGVIGCVDLCDDLVLVCNDGCAVQMVCIDEVILEWILKRSQK